MEHTLRDTLGSYIEDAKQKKEIKDAFAYLKASNDQSRIDTNYNVALILGNLKIASDVIIVALLRELDLSDLDTSLFEPEIFKLLDYAATINQVDNISSKENDYEDYRNVLVIMAKDYRIIVLELATRLHLMRINKKENYATKHEFANETLNIYAPLAHRLGLGKLKTELEELSLYFLDKEVYLEIARGLELKKEQRDSLVNEMITSLDEIIAGASDNLTIFGRSKSIYSIYKKTYKRGKTMDDIFDLQAIRIICDNKIECYTILGLIHEKYPPLSGRFKDYIAVRKPNLYQSLHTSVIGPEHQIFEIQIRTYEMDEIAERGIAAHWRYKEGDSNKNMNDIEEQLHLFRDVIKTGEEVNESEIQALQNNIFEASIYTLTPNGKIINLPKHATVIDFAYRVHTRVAETMVGAIVNGKIAKYDYELQNGDVVQIKTKNNFEAPTIEWLEQAKTTKAKRKIRSFLKLKRERDLAVEIERGKEQLAIVLRKNNIDPDIMEPEKDRARVLGKFSFQRLSEFYYAIGTKRLNPEDVVEFLSTEESTEPKLTLSHASEDNKEEVIIPGAKGIARTLAPCCSPIYGDDIVGVIATGVGIKVHRKECLNLVHNPKLNKVNAVWNPVHDSQTKYACELLVLADDRPNLLQETVLTLNKQGVGIENFASRVGGDTVKMTLNLIVSDISDINKVINNIKKIRNIISVDRVLK